MSSQEFCISAIPLLHQHVLMEEFGNFVKPFQPRTLEKYMGYYIKTMKYSSYRYVKLRLRRLIGTKIGLFISYTVCDPEKALDCIILVV